MIFFLLYINVVIQLLMFMLPCSFSCAAFVIQYILAWDGEKMAHDFTSVSLRIIVNSKFVQNEMKTAM